MQNLILSFNAVAPICVILLTGMLLRKTGIMSAVFVDQSNGLMYKFLLPILVFKGIFFSEQAGDLSIRTPLYALIAITVEYIAAALLCVKLFPDRRRAAASAQAMVRSNFLVIGLSMGTSLMGESCAATISMIAPFTVCLYAIGANLIFSIVLQSGKIQWKKTVWRILSTPVLIASITAVFLKMLHVGPCPAFIESSIQSIATCVTPLALLLLGAQMDTANFKDDFSTILVCCLGRLIVFPVLAFSPVLIWGHFSQPELVALFLLFFTPCAVNGYFEAIAQNADYELSGNTVFFSTLLSLITLFCFIFAFRQIGIFQ